MFDHHYKKSIQQAWKDGCEMLEGHAGARVALGMSLLFLAGTFALPIWRILPLAADTSFIALHYNIYLGVDRFGPLWHVFFTPMLGLFYLVLNLIVQAFSWRHQKTLALFFAMSTPALEFVLLVAMALIVLINL